jgi:hypothetical protein
MTAKPISIKSAVCKFGGCALKAVEITSGGLRRVVKTRPGLERSRLVTSQKSAEGIVVVKTAKARTVGSDK